MEFGDEIIKVLNYLCEKVGVTIDWTNENVFPYVEKICAKYIQWEINTSIAWIVIALVFLLITFIVCKKFKKSYNEEDIFQYFHLDLIIFLLVTLFIVTPVICVQVFDIIQCCSFPEKQIYEYITDYINSNSNNH